MDHQINNIFQKTPEYFKEESIEILLETKAVRIERIVSKGHASPPGFWYDQDKDEFVMLLEGGAGILFEAKAELKIMKPGDYLHIPAHARHRVEWTDPLKETVWMAVFY